MLGRAYRHLRREYRKWHRVSGRSNQVTKLKGHADAIVCTLPLDHFDIIYIDGSHDAADVHHGRDAFLAQG